MSIKKIVKNIILDKFNKLKINNFKEFLLNKIKIIKNKPKNSKK